MSSVDVTECCNACGERFPITHMRSFVEDGVREYICLDTRACRKRVHADLMDMDVRASLDDLRRRVSSLERQVTELRAHNERLRDAAVYDRR